ncbi:MAG: hypothetical protein O2877_01535, partial [bacterium]|nr:hypothetical protein [bacterium]
LPIDWDSSSLILAHGVRSDSTITWTTEEIENFETLGEGQEGVIDLVLPLLENVDPTIHSDNFILVATTTASPSTNTKQRQTLSTTPLLIRLNSNLTIISSARYHESDGTPIGTGPLPPIVGETTEYEILWSASNSLHPLENIVFETDLPSHVQFSEGATTTAGTISYNNEQRNIRWEIPSINAGNATARFRLRITPSESNIGTFLKLTNPVNVVARDTITETSLRLEGDTLTTQLPDDTFANGKGVVLE